MVAKFKDKDRSPADLVIGVGAATGGPEAFKHLLKAFPDHVRMTFLLVQHLDAAYESLLAELRTLPINMQIAEARQGVLLRSNTIYIAPPNTALAVRKGKIELTTPRLQRDIRLPIDHLLRSLAQAFGARAVGIVLSGTGGDGGAGLREIKGVGGLAILEKPADALQAGALVNAIDASGIDLTLPIIEIPAAVKRFAMLSVSAEDDDDLQPSTEEGYELARSPVLNEQATRRLTAVLEAHADFDLRIYKPVTIQRRLLRRMTLAGFDEFDAYLAHLREDETERDALVRDLLISVTDFFRDAEAFETLRILVIEPLVEAARIGETLRVWVSACATGEEAYSIAMEFLDAIEKRNKRIALQVFATDVDQDVLAVGRAGIYPLSITDQISPERLKKYFSLWDGKAYRVRPSLRDVVSFAVHDLCKDPPFSRMNLVTCRNVLIYLRQTFQEHVLKVLHFALQPDSYLFLGSSEATGSQRQLFATLSKKWRIYRKVGTSRPLIVARGGVRQIRGESEPAPLHQELAARASTRGESNDLVRRVVMQALVPPTIVVSEAGEVIFMHGELRPYLRFPDGDPRLDLSSVMTSDLATRVRAALYKCRRDRTPVVAFSSPDGQRRIRTKITAAPAFELGDGAVILTFEDIEDAAPDSLPAVSESPAQEAVIEQLEKELHATREDLRNTVEELETSNEELRSSHEESMSMNEELQSTNEELEATTEELRSLNEELTTVNVQLREKVEQLEQAHDDLNNFLASTKIATVFLDERLCIKRFTPAAEELLRINRSYEGRFINDIARELLQNDLVEEAHWVLEHLSPRVRDLRTENGRWIARRVLPYRTESRRIEGVVVTLVDITELKTTTERLAVRERQQAVIARLGLHALEELDLQSFLDRAVREVQQALETDYCKILELQPGGKVLLLRAGVGWREGLVGHASVSTGADSQAGFTLRAQQPIIVEDLRKERRFNGPPLLFEHGVVSGISCVIRDSGEPYGAPSTP